MAKLTQAERFIQSKCDRCGKATKARQNDIGDLYVLPWEGPLHDLGDFCEPCIERYDEANWLVWFREHRPADLA